MSKPQQGKETLNSVETRNKHSWISPAEFLSIERHRQAKQQHPESIVLVRVGDFYETYGLDATNVSALIGCKLTTMKMKDKQIAMIGFPHNCLEDRIRSLLSAKQKVTIVA